MSSSRRAAITGVEQPSGIVRPWSATPHGKMQRMNRGFIARGINVRPDEPDDSAQHHQQEFSTANSRAFQNRKRIDRL